MTATHISALNMSIEYKPYTTAGCSAAIRYTVTVTSMVQHFQIPCMYSVISGSTVL